MKVFKFTCKTCNSVFTLEYSDDEVAIMVDLGVNPADWQGSISCTACNAKADAIAARKAELRWHHALLEETNIPRERIRWDEKKGNNELLRFVSTNIAKSLFIADEYGVGKTWSTCYMAWQEKLAKKHVRFFVVADLTASLSMLYADDMRGAERLVRELKTCDLLVLDDFGKERATDRAGEALFRVLDARYRDNRRTWITSNLTLNELAEKWEDRGGSIKRRIREYYASWIQWRDRRAAGDLL